MPRDPCLMQILTLLNINIIIEVNIGKGQKNQKGAHQDGKKVALRDQYGEDSRTMQKRNTRGKWGTAIKRDREKSKGIETDMDLTLVSAMSSISSKFSGLFVIRTGNSSQDG